MLETTVLSRLYPASGATMRITQKEVEHVATLARLKLDHEEISTFTGQMDAILSYVDKLSGLNTDGIIPTSHAVPMENAFRPDEIRPSLGTDNALANAPEHVEGFFQVPKVIE
jgi:aspartyl-tRNA(Asn)/glutamyl-tRNA(Gln) amidotransferase subunit C